MGDHELITPRIQEISVSYLARNLTVHPRLVPLGIFGEQSGTWIVFLGVLWFPTASIMPPFARTHPFLYNRRCIILAFDSVVKNTLKYGKVCGARQC